LKNEPLGANLRFPASINRKKPLAIAWRQIVATRRHTFSTGS
jgi:hypothetical protein